MGLVTKRNQQLLKGSSRVAVCCFLLLAVFFIPTTVNANKDAIVDSLYTELKKDLHDTLRVQYMNDIAWVIKFNDVEEAFKLAHKAMALAQKINFKKQINNGCNVIGALHYLESNYSDAIAYFKKGLELSIADKDSAGQAKSYNNIGLIYDELGDYEMSLSYYLKSLELKKILGHKVGIANSNNNIAIIYEALGNYDKSIEYNKKSLKISTELEDDVGRSRSFNNIGIVLQKKKEYIKSLEYFMKSLKLEQEIGNERGIAQSYNNVGSVYKDMENYKKSLEYLFKGLEIKKELNDQQYLAASYINIGELYKGMEDYEKAKEYLEKGLEFAKVNNNKQDQKTAFLGLSNIHRALGNYKLALKYSQELIAVKDSIFNENVATQMNEIEAKYQNTQKQQEIELLSQKNKVQDLEIGKQRLISYGVGAGLLVILFFSVLMWRNFRQKKQAYVLLEEKQDQLKEKNTEIMDSIAYAKRLQDAILPTEERIQKLLPNSFVLFKPKDIVSGDFYWIENVESKILIAAIDCTGHGVPGAFMSIVGHNGLSKAVNEYGLNSPHKILQVLNQSVRKTLQAKKSQVRDGMDLAMCAIDKNRETLEFSGAMNPLYLVRDNNITEIKGDKQAIGGREEEAAFTNHKVELKKGDTVYLFTDGFADQFGGDKGKKYKYRPFKELLLSIQDKTMEDQHAILSEEFDSWKGDLEQIDDVCIIGVRV